MPFTYTVALRMAGRLLRSASSFVHDQWRCSPIATNVRQFSTGALLRDKVTSVIVSPDKKTISLEFDGARQHTYHVVSHASPSLPKEGSGELTYQELCQRQDLGVTNQIPTLHYVRL